jgi:hypothetical protein
MWSTTIQNRVGSGWREDLSAVDRRALTEMLVDKIIIERHPSKIGEDGSRHYLIRAIPYQDPEMEAVRLKAMHEASQDRPQGLSGDPARSHTQTRPATSERVCFRLDSMRGDEDHGMRNSGPGLALNLRTFARHNQELGGYARTRPRKFFPVPGAENKLDQLGRTSRPRPFSRSRT